MINDIRYRRCTKCESINIIKNGHDYKGAQKFHCHDCYRYGTLDTKRHYDAKTRQQAMDAYFERVSMRGVHRVFGISRYLLAQWLLTNFEKLPSLAETLVKWEPGDVLELDELWSFVLKKSQKRWVWIALCRRTRQVVAFAIGDRSEDTCRKLWNQIPVPYKLCASFSDFWDAYKIVFPESTHRCIGKETGLTAHVERWNLSIRQSLARFVRKTLSFSKSDTYHEAVLSLFIYRYNLILKHAISQF
jgi:IS1 family transposase/transposase-like protein